MNCVAGLLVALMADLAVAGCPIKDHSGQRLSSGPIELAWRAEPKDIVVGRPFVVRLELCPADAQLKRVDATMPAHRHGMNYRPSLHALGDGRWRVEGLLWHMSGDWELRFDAEVAGELHTLRQGVTQQ